MRIGKPVDGAGAPVDLGVGVAFGAAGYVEDLTVVRFWGFVGALRIGPVREVGSYEICGWIVIWFLFGLLGESEP